MTTPTTAVGYIRVSTERQNEGDHALERQAEKIRRYCADRGIRLLCICDDTCSAMGNFSIERRPGLNDALRWAVREGACLIVPEATRLFRNVAVAERWLQSVTVPILSIQDNKMLSRSEVLDAVAVGQRVGKATGLGTVKALDEIKMSGVKLGSKADRKAANAASKRARAQRSDSIVDAIARVMLEDQAYRDLSHRAFADLLNRRNILTGWSRPWTSVGVRRQREEAEMRILEWEELERDDVPGEPLPPTIPFQPAPPPVVEPENDEQKMKALPIFGMF
ncbi:MAG TPA: recombinase family protein [Hyphomonas sp.]|nr:recombinase family protein [Hyphomonas sp.]